MTKTEKLREQNNCATCERRGGYADGCQAFNQEPDNCWAHTTDKDWQTKVNQAVKEYINGQCKGE